MAKQFQARQGDVFLEKIPVLPENRELKPVKRDRGAIVLAYGEETGHSHKVKERTATLFVDQKDVDQRFLEIVEAAKLEHEEHGTIDLEPGVYRVVRQREWSEDDSSSRWVAD